MNRTEDEKSLIRCLCSDDQFCNHWDCSGKDKRTIFFLEQRLKEFQKISDDLEELEESLTDVGVKQRLTKIIDRYWER